MAKLLKAKTGELRFGELVIPCAVLEDGRSVLSAQGVAKAFGSKREGFRAVDGLAKVPDFLSSKALFGSLSGELSGLQSPVIYQPGHGGRPAHGYEAKLLPDICWAILDAESAGKLRKNQARLAGAARALLKALSGVAIDALVYDACRVPRQYGELQKLLDSYLTAEARKWSREFPPSFYAAMAKCRPRQRLVGMFINYAVYERMPVPLLPEFDRLNPRVNGRRRRCNHQHVSDHGLPVLREHIAVITKLMEISHDTTHFEHLLVRAYPKIGDQLRLGLAELPPGASV